MPINYPNLIAAIDAEISRLQRARKLLAALMTVREAVEPRRQVKPKKHVLSAEARARISAAQKKRWAQQKKAAKG